MTVYKYDKNPYPGINHFNLWTFSCYLLYGKEAHFAYRIRIIGELVNGDSKNSRVHTLHMKTSFEELMDFQIKLF